jgi:hypothetical protein
VTEGRTGDYNNGQQLLDILWPGFDAGRRLTCRCLQQAIFCQQVGILRAQVTQDAQQLNAATAVA